MPQTTKPVWAAVLPSAPQDYDQRYMARLVDIVNKLIEQIVEPRQLTAATAVFSDLPQETPRYQTEGEVYTKVCGGCGATVLAIHQTIPEGAQHHARRHIRAGIVSNASDGNDHRRSSGEAASEDPAGSEARRR